MKAEAQVLPFLLFSRLLSILLLAVCFFGPRPASGQAAEKVTVFVTGTVAKKGKHLLEPPATIEAAFAAAGGFNGKGGFSADGGVPPSFCTLRVKAGNVNAKIRLAIDPKTKVVRVLEENWRTYVLPEGAFLSLPLVLF